MLDPSFSLFTHITHLLLKLWFQYNLEESISIYVIAMPSINPLEQEMHPSQGIPELD